jgi:hypothetical protein
MAGGIETGDFLAFLHAAIAIPPGTHDIEVLQGEANGIELGMTTGTALRFGVFGEQIADRGGTADVRLDGGHALRRRWRWLTQQLFHDPNAAQHGRGGGAVCGVFHERGLRDETSKRAAFRQGHTLHGGA